jgi:lipopolysaccharide export LptBFGC system permease protein LptF
MPISFYLVAISIFAAIFILFYRSTITYIKQEGVLKETRRKLVFTFWLKLALPLSVLATVLVMLAVEYFFY